VPYYDELMTRRALYAKPYTVVSISVLFQALVFISVGSLGDYGGDATRYFLHVRVILYMYDM
jgi:MFS-type transporter involved in bile tolerance (Atg22 family)